jgi:hypothetical protein
MTSTKSFRFTWSCTAIAATLLLAVGCREEHKHAPAEDKAAKTTAKDSDSEEAEVLAARATLSAEDRKLVDAQEWCVVSNDRLGSGSMGVPIKLMIKDQPVFICCGGCKPEANADPDKTLAKLEKLKDKKRAEPSAK